MLICDNCGSDWDDYLDTFDDEFQDGDECPECGGNLEEEKEE